MNIYKDLDGFINVKGRCYNDPKHFSRIGFVDTIGEGRVVKFSCTSCNSMTFITLREFYNNAENKYLVKELG